MANGGFTLHLNQGDMRRAAKALNDLERTERTPLMRKAFKAAMTPMVKQGKENIKTRNSGGEGNLKKSITKRAYPSKLYAIAGGQRKGAFLGNHLHLVDRGTKIRFKKDGRTTGKMYAGKTSTRWGKKLYVPHGKPYAWTDAWNATKAQVAKILLDGFKAAVAHIWYNKP